MKDPIIKAPIRPGDELMLIDDVASIPAEALAEMTDGGGDDAQ